MARSRRRARIERLVRTNALRKGLLGGSPLWRSVWVLGQLRNMWGKVSKSGKGPVTYSKELPQGEALIITHLPEKTRRGRGEGRRYLVGPKRERPHIEAGAAAAALKAARRAVETTSKDSSETRA